MDSNWVMVYSSIGETIRAFIATDALVTLDPDEFNIKWIQGKRQTIDMMAK